MPIAGQFLFLSNKIIPPYLTGEIISSNSRIGSFVSTMEEAARVLKKAGAKEVIGIVIARAAPGQDQFKNV